MKRKIAPFSHLEPSLRFYTLVMFVASVLFTGYRVYFHNQSLQLPLVNWLNDRTLYPNDPFAATLPYYASSLWMVTAWCVREGGLEPVLLVFFLLERFLIIYAAGNLARTFAPRSVLAAVGAMAFFAFKPEPLIGGGTLVMAYFEQTSLAVALFMLAAAAFHRQKPALWAVLLALGFNCNSLYGAYALSYFGAVFLLDADYRREWKVWLSSLGLFLIVASPAIYMSAGAYGKGGFDNNLWIVASRVRVPHHIFPSSWKTWRFVAIGFLAATLVATLWDNRKNHGRLAKHGMIWTGVCAGWVALAFAAEAMKSSGLMLMQPARATDLWYCFAVAAILAVCTEQHDEERQVEWFASAAALIGVLFWGGTSGFWAVTLLVWLPLRLLARRGTDTRRLAAIITLVVFLVGLGMFGYRWKSKGSLTYALVSHPPHAERSVAEWAASSTAKDSVFLVNPNWGDFRSIARRPVFVTWKDGSALLWYRPYAKEWVQRIREMGYDIVSRNRPAGIVGPALDALYLRFTDKDAADLKAKYGVRYWVVGSDFHSSYPVAFRNKTYKVLEVQ